MDAPVWSTLWQPSRQMRCGWAPRPPRRPPRSAALALTRTPGRLETGKRKTLGVISRFPVQLARRSIQHPCFSSSQHIHTRAPIPADSPLRKGRHRWPWCKTPCGRGKCAAVPRSQGLHLHARLSDGGVVAAAPATKSRPRNRRRGCLVTADATRAGSIGVGCLGTWASIGSHKQSKHP